MAYKQAGYKFVFMGGGGGGGGLKKAVLMKILFELTHF